MFKGGKMADDSEIPLVVKQTYEFGSHTIKLDSLDFIGKCSSYGTCSRPGGYCRTPENGRELWSPLVNFVIDGEDYFYEGSQVGSPTKTPPSWCYAFEPSINYLDTWLDIDVTKNKEPVDWVLYNIGNYNIMLKNNVFWSVPGRNKLEALDSCSLVYGGGVFSSSLNSCNADYPIGLELVKTDYAISSVSPTTAEYGLGFNMEVTVESFDDLTTSFIEVDYTKADGTQYTNKYQRNMMNGTNIESFPIPTDVLGAVDMVIRAGMVVDIDKERVYYFTDDIYYTVNVQNTGQGLPADANGDNCISFNEIMNYANQWINKQGVYFEDVMQAANSWIGRNKAVC